MPYPRANAKFCSVSDPRDPENVLQVDFVITYRGLREQVLGRPDDCYPGAAPELEVFSAVDVGGAEVLRVLTADQVSEIEQEILATYDFEPDEIELDLGRSLYRIFFRPRPEQRPLVAATQDEEPF